MLTSPMVAGIVMGAQRTGIPSDPQTLGAIGLVLAAAALVGIIVYRLLSKHGFAARELSLVAAFLTVVGLAYAGVPAAGVIVLAAVIVVAVVWALMFFAGL